MFNSKTAIEMGLRRARRTLRREIGADIGSRGRGESKGERNSVELRGKPPFPLLASFGICSSPEQTPANTRANRSGGVPAALGEAEP